MDNKWSSGIDQHLRTKDYEALSEEDKAWVNEHLGGKPGYAHLAKLAREAAIVPAMPTKPATKAALMAQMKAKHKPAWKSALAYKMPAYMASAMVAIAIVATRALMPTPETPEAPKALQPVAHVRVDTVYLRSAPDTVVIERQVRVPVYIAVNKAPQKGAPQEAHRGNGQRTGKPLAALDEVRDLLVRAE